MIQDRNACIFWKGEKTTKIWIWFWWFWSEQIGLNVIYLGEPPAAESKSADIFCVGAFFGGKFDNTSSKSMYFLKSEKMTHIWIWFWWFWSEQIGLDVIYLGEPPAAEYESADIFCVVPFLGEKIDDSSSKSMNFSQKEENEQNLILNWWFWSEYFLRGTIFIV
jgi:hypothetical protein